jgi:hypothetical protein
MVETGEGRHVKTCFYKAQTGRVKCPAGFLYFSLSLWERARVRVLHAARDSTLILTFSQREKGQINMPLQSTRFYPRITGRFY